MAKDKKTNASKDESTRVRSSFGLPPEWMHVLSHLSTARQKDVGELIQAMLEREFAGLPRAESEAIRTLVRLATGRTLRMSITTGAIAAENAVEPAGQGASLASGSPAMPDALQARTDAISARFKQTTAPLDAALSALAGGD